MSKKISLTIVIPAYNEENHLKACLNSIARQTEKPDEVIVVDNNSTDKTVEIAKTYPFVTVVHEPKQGIVFARNRGFNAANSDIIGRIDADTRLPRNWVARVKDFYADGAHTNTALTGGGYFYNLRWPRVNGWLLSQMAYRFNRLLMGHYILFGSNMAIPKTIWQNVRGLVCHNTGVHEDLDLAIHTHRAGYEITYRKSLKVGVKMRRVRSAKHELWDNLMWWPKTLRKHGQWTWIFGWVGALFLYITSPLIIVLEYAARLFGRKPLPD